MLTIPIAPSANVTKAHATEEPIHRRKDLAHGFLIFYGVPFFPRIFSGRIEATVIAGDDTVEFIFGNFVFFEGARLIVDERNGVAFLGVVALKREELAHGVKRDEDADVGGVLFFMSDHGEHADDLEADAIEQDCVAHGGAAGEHVAGHLTSENANATALGVIVVVEPASDFERDGTHLTVNCGHAGDLTVGAGVIANGANVVAGDDGRDVQRELGFVFDGDVIVVGEIEPLHRIEAAFDGGDAASEKEDDVFAEGFELLAIAVAEAFANTGEQEERADAPGDSEHGQEGTKFVGPKSSNGLSEGFEKHAHFAPLGGQKTVEGFAGLAALCVIHFDCWNQQPLAREVCCRVIFMAGARRPRNRQRGAGATPNY